MRFEKNSEISENWPFFIGWWRHNDVNGRYFWHSKHSRDVLLSCRHFDFITGRLCKMVQCTKFWYEKCNFWDLTHFQWPVTSWWRNLSDIFDILSNPEEFHYDVIIVTSSLVTLVTGYCVPRKWTYKCGRIPDSPLLTSTVTLPSCCFTDPLMHSSIQSPKNFV